MASFLDLKPEERRQYVAQLMGMNPNAPDSWGESGETIDRTIRIAERAADDAAQTEVRLLTSGR